MSRAIKHYLQPFYYLILFATILLFNIICNHFTIYLPNDSIKFSFLHSIIINLFSRCLSNCTILIKRKHSRQHRTRCQPMKSDVDDVRYLPVNQSLYCHKFLTSSHHFTFRSVFELAIKTKYLSHLMTKPTKWLCPQQRLRSAWTSAQPDQSLCCVLNGKLRTQAFFMQTAKTLIRVGWRPGWSASSWAHMPSCWFCHEAAHLKEAD